MKYKTVKNVELLNVFFFHFYSINHTTMALYYGIVFGILTIEVKEKRNDAGNLKNMSVILM